MQKFIHRQGEQFFFFAFAITFLHKVYIAEIFIFEEISVFLLQEPFMSLPVFDSNDDTAPEFLTRLRFLEKEVLKFEDEVNKVQ